MEAYDASLPGQELSCPGCGITLWIPAGQTEVWCEYCGQKRRRSGTAETQAIPARAELLRRANRACERMAFDEAMVLYRMALMQEPGDLQAHWGMIRCRYGVQIIRDEDQKNRYLMCSRRAARPVENTDEFRGFAQAAERARNKKEAEALRGDIDTVSEQQKHLRALRNEGAAREYDVFLCYRHSARGANGRVGASRDRAWVARFHKEMLRQIGEQGCDIRVFYAPETMKAFPGTPYAAVIAHALFSSRAMLLMGTEPEAFTSPWVRAESGHFRSLTEEYGLDRRMIPVLNRSAAEDPNASVAEVFPPEYRNMQAVIFRDDELREAVRGVIGSILEMNRSEDGSDSFRHSRRERAYDGLLEEKRLLEARTAELQSELEEALARERSAEADRDRLRGDRDQMQMSRQESAAELEKSRQMADAFRGLYNQETKKNEGFQTALRETQSEIRALKKDLADARKTIAERERDMAGLREAGTAAAAGTEALAQARAAIEEQKAALAKAKTDYINRGAELAAAKRNIGRMEAETEALREQVGERDKALAEMRRELDALRGQSGPKTGRSAAESGETVQLRGYGFRSVSAGGVASTLLPDLGAEKNLRHPERIRWITVNLHSPLPSRIRALVRLTCRENGFDETRDVSLRPRQMAEVLFDIDSGQLARYSGTYRLTVTDTDGRELLADTLTLRSALR